MSHGDGDGHFLDRIAAPGFSLYLRAAIRFVMLGSDSRRERSDRDRCQTIDGKPTRYVSELWNAKCLSRKKRSVDLKRQPPSLRQTWGHLRKRFSGPNPKRHTSISVCFTWFTSFDFPFVVFPFYFFSLFLISSPLLLPPSAPPIPVALHSLSLSLCSCLLCMLRLLCLPLRFIELFLNRSHP